jgi:hypothetical protein
MRIALVRGKSWFYALGMSTWDTVTQQAGAGSGTRSDAGDSNGPGGSMPAGRRWVRTVKVIALLAVALVMIPVLIVSMFAVALVLLGVKLITGELTLVRRWVGWAMQKVGTWLTDDGRRNVRVVR